MRANAQWYLSALPDSRHLSPPRYYPMSSVRPSTYLWHVPGYSNNVITSGTAYPVSLDCSGGRWRPPNGYEGKGTRLISFRSGGKGCLDAAVITHCKGWRNNACNFNRMFLEKQSVGFQICLLINFQNTKKKYLHYVVVGLLGKELYCLCSVVNNESYNTHRGAL